MKTIFFVFLVTILSIKINAQCDDYSLKQESVMTQNIALVKGGAIIGDSVVVEILKKWKGDSIHKYVKFKLENAVSKYFRVDTGKNYMLFWYNGMAIDRCSRSSEFKLVHFEEELDDLLPLNKVQNSSLYDSIKYNRRNKFISYKEGVEYNIQKGKYAFYDMELGKVVPFKSLPKELSSYYPRRFYFIDKNVETAVKTYDAVFAVLIANKELIVSKELRKRALQACFK
jgi:hypothetical protein